MSRMFDDLVSELGQYGIRVIVNSFINSKSIDLDFDEFSRPFEERIKKLKDENLVLKEKVCELSCKNEESEEYIKKLEESRGNCLEAIISLENKCSDLLKNKDNEEILTPLEFVNSLVNKNIFSVKELKEISEYLNVYYRNYNTNNAETMSF